MRSSTTSTPQIIDQIRKNTSALPEPLRSRITSQLLANLGRVPAPEETVVSTAGMVLTLDSNGQCFVWQDGTSRPVDLAQAWSWIACGMDMKEGWDRGDAWDRFTTAVLMTLCEGLRHAA
jgi:hypothetical protein